MVACSEDTYVYSCMHVLKTYTCIDCTSSLQVSSCSIPSCSCVKMAPKSYAKGDQTLTAATLQNKVLEPWFAKKEDRDVWGLLAYIRKNVIFCNLNTRVISEVSHACRSMLRKIDLLEDAIEKRTYIYVNLCMCEYVYSVFVILRSPLVWPAPLVTLAFFKLRSLVIFQPPLDDLNFLYVPGIPSASRSLWAKSIDNTHGWDPWVPCPPSVSGPWAPTYGQGSCAPTLSQ